MTQKNHLLLGDLTEKVIGIFYQVHDPHCEGKMINYLPATDIEVGLVLHFGVKPKFKRLVYSNDRKLPRRHSA